MHSADSTIELIDRNISALGRTVATPSAVGDAFLDAMDQPTELTSYKHFPPECLAIWRSALAGEAGLGGRIFLARLILMGMKRTLMGKRFFCLPARVQAGQSKHFHWLADQLTGTEDWLDLAHDTFQKELRAAVLHLYVCGSQLVEYRSGISKRLVLQGGLRNAIPAIVYFLRAGGFKPYFQIHMHVHLRNQFNEAGRRECYHCCAELYAMHPEILGMFGGSWFYDPFVAKISPHLGYVQEVPVEGGAHLFRWGITEGSTRDALLTSSTRRGLADQGQYVPCSYFLVWDKASQLQWAATA